MKSTDPRVVAWISQLRSLLMVAGTVMATLGLTASPAYQWIMIGGGIVTAVVPAVWDFIALTAALFHVQAVGVASGVAMTTQGKALASDGETVITKFGAGPEATPPKPITVETATQIVKDFAPAEPIKAV